MMTKDAEIMMSPMSTEAVSSSPIPAVCVAFTSSRFDAQPDG